jgi:hypothetical protein
VADARASLDEETFTAAWAEGRVMTLEEAIRVALDERKIPPHVRILRT